MGSQGPGDSRFTDPFCCIICQWERGVQSAFLNWWPVASLSVLYYSSVQGTTVDLRTCTRAEEGSKIKGKEEILRFIDDTNQELSEHFS